MKWKVAFGARRLSPTVPLTLGFGDGEDLSRHQCVQALGHEATADEAEAPTVGLGHTTTSMVVHDLVHVNQLDRLGAESHELPLRTSRRAPSTALSNSRRERCLVFCRMRSTT